MKILSLNAGYFLGYDGTLSDYIRHPLRGFLGDSAIQSRRVNRFTRLVKEIEPDTVLLQEVDQGSIRSTRVSRPEEVSRQLSDGFEAFAATKYCGWVNSLPFLGKMSNAIVYREGKLKNHYLETGRKSLVQEISLEGYSIFSVHLARFGSAVRHNQIKELEKIVHERDEYVVAGDFNFHNKGEAQQASDVLKAEASTDGETFPVKNPRKTLDMAFSSKGLDVDLEVLDRKISDHRPLVIDVDKV